MPAIPVIADVVTVFISRAMIFATWWIGAVIRNGPTTFLMRIKLFYS